MRYRDETLRHLAVPLGGIGTGTVALGGEGGLRQWQLFNQIDHTAFVPDSFFAARVATGRPPRTHVRILQSEPALSLPRGGTPLVDDDAIPRAQATLVEHFGGMTRASVETRYPFVTVDYEDEALPVSFQLEAFTPFAALDVEQSSLPLAVFTVAARNNGPGTYDVRLAATVQNAVGWDGSTPIDGTRCALYGGNRNHVERDERRVAVVLGNPTLAAEHPRSGELALAALTPEAAAFPRWQTTDAFMAFLGRAELDLHGGRGRGLVTPDDVPSPAGETWNAGLVVPLRLEPGEEATACFALAWWFPNRVVNWLNCGPRRVLDEHYPLGNAYTAPFGGALGVVDHVASRLEALRERSAEWADLFSDTSLPDTLAEGMAAQAAAVRSPVLFRTGDGRFFGFEGGNGASTLADGRGVGGSCPLNCTHVWNYAQTVARLFPELERSMRETELLHMLHPTGFLPHRVVLPLDLPQFDDEIGGPDLPALDGMLGCVLKMLREVRAGAGREWLDVLWPELRRLLDYVCERWDPDGDGLLRGEQPNTYDIAFRGIDPFVGGLWLAALGAGARLAEIAGDPTLARALVERRRAGSDRYDELCWNGEYYHQVLGPEDDDQDQFGLGCLADQVVGQWWAHQLGLGYVLSREHVRESLRSIVRHNLRERIGEVAHDGRVFADGDDAGLLLCTWPHGGRPAVPFRYCDEVWTGVEYHVAAHCLYEGLHEEAECLLAGTHARYSGARRNPYNHVECGDHYVRALAGWSVLDALAGVGYDAGGGTLEIRPVPDFRGPWAVGAACGRVTRTITTCSVEVVAGTLHVERLDVARPPTDPPSLPMKVRPGERLELNWSDGIR